MLQNILFTWFTIVYFTSGLFINFLQLLILPIYWIYRDLYHILIFKLCYCLYSELTFMAEWWGDIDLKVYGDKNDINMITKESSIVLMNHYSDIDWLIGWVFSERMGVLGIAKVFIKDLVKYVPTLGWSWWFADYGFVKRDWQKDESQMVKVLRGLQKQVVPFSMTLFCEGTRRTEKKLKASQEHAISNGIEPLKHHLLPRTKGFCLAVKELSKTVPAIYDIEYAFTCPEQATISHIVNQGKIEVHLYFRRIPMSLVPSESLEASSSYCIELYREKDKLMDYFINKGCFPGPVVPLPRKMFNALTFAAYNILVGGLFVFLCNYCVELYGSFAVVGFLSAICIIGFMSVHVLIQASQTKKGSSFGLKKESKKTE